MSTAIDFTVIVPTRDRPAQLAECLSGLARVDFPRERFEVIVVDDGPGTAAPVAEAAELEVSYLKGGGHGPAAARNLGAHAAAGRHLAFTDDDCVPRPGWLAAFLDGARRNPDALLGGTTVNGAPTRASDISQSVVDAAYATFNTDPADARFFAANNMSVPAHPFREQGGFDASFRTAEDRLLCARWRGAGGRLVAVPNAVVEHYRRLDVTALWRQHYAYGQGAYRFHRACGSSRLVSRPEFYAELVRRQLDRGVEAPVFLGLLAVQQAANAAGYLSMIARGAVDRIAGVTPVSRRTT